MRTYRQDSDHAAPTRDHELEVSDPTHANADYDLHPRKGGFVGIKTSYGEHTLSSPEKEENSLVFAGKTDVSVRSGNQHWDDEGDENFELAGTGPQENKNVEDPGKPFALTLSLVAGIALVYFLCKKDR